MSSLGRCLINGSRIGGSIVRCSRAICLGGLTSSFSETWEDGEHERVMATAAPVTERKPSLPYRPTLSHFQPDPSSPHTPQRQISSTLSSPSVSFRAEEEAIVVEVGARHLSAGFAGEESARYHHFFGPENARRVADYRQHAPGYELRGRKRRRLSTWGDDHEVWQMDIRQMELGLVGDKIERAMREAYTKYLLVETRARKVCLIVPSVLPHRLLERILQIFFEKCQVPAVALLSPATMATVGSGCRNGLVIDLGWKETFVTAVYEYREVAQSSTVRAMKMVTKEMAKMLERAEREKKDNTQASDETTMAEISVDVEQAEEVTARMAWCSPQSSGHPASPSSNTTPTKSQPNPLASQQPQSDQQSHFMTVPSPHSPRDSLTIPWQSFSDLVETALFAPSVLRHDQDDHNHPLPLLIYLTLLRLPPDIRSTVMSRIMFIGGGASIPGLKSRLLNEVTQIISERGFDGVFGAVADKRRLKSADGHALAPGFGMSLPTRDKALVGNDEKQRGPLPSSVDLNVSQQTPLRDDITDALELEKAKTERPAIQGIIRGVETLGAWAGASLMSSLRVKGVVDVERESWMQYGLSGARKEHEQPTVRDRRSYVPEVMKGNWTLGAWA